MEYNDKNLITHPKLLWITLTVVGLMLLAFIFQKPLHLENATIAMAAGLILVFIGSLKKWKQLFSMILIGLPSFSSLGFL